MSDYWTPPPIWAGQTAHVIASGPSATQEVIDRLRGKNVVAVNSTVLSAAWAQVWFFMDGAVLLQRGMLEFGKRFAGYAVTTSRKAKSKLWPDVHWVHAPKMGEFPPAPGIRAGRSSGQTAISLAMAMGAKRIELHGFDMRVVNGREHHHREYEGRPRDVTIYERKFLPAFDGWNEQAMRAGVSIVNATPGSALKEFPMVDA